MHVIRYRFCCRYRIRSRIRSRIRCDHCSVDRFPVDCCDGAAAVAPHAVSSRPCHDANAASASSCHDASRH